MHTIISELQNLLLHSHFFSLAAVDHEQHLHNIQELMDALMNEELVNALLEAHTVEELQQAAQTYEA